MALAATIVLLAGASAGAIGLPPLPPLPPPVTAPPILPPLPAPTPAPINGVLNVPAPPTGAGGSGQPAGVAGSGAAALAALGDILAQLQGGDPLPADNSRQGPRDNRGMNRQAEDFDRQQYVMTAQVQALNASQDAQQAVFAGGGSGRFAWPEKYRTVSQGFGCTALRLAPTSANCRSGHFHTGVDIAGPDQADVYAADTGIVRIFRGATGYGNYAIITHGNGYSTLYGHLHDFTVKDGDLVQRGDPIAHEGTSGNSTGPHLHFEVRSDGGYLDPCPFLEGCGKTP